MLDCELIGVTRRYGDVVALEDVSFGVHHGEFVTLLGPSGGGKSSTLRIIAGFLRPDAGRVLLRGEVVNDVAPYDRDIGMVFQNYALFPHMTVGDNVAFGLRMRRVPRPNIGPRVREALDLVRLAGLEARYPDELSGGQQQRVAIARALAIRPALLLMDEPMSNLDAALRTAMRFELRQILSRVGVTTVYVTHNQEEALSMSDRVVVMSHGHVEQVGKPLDIYGRPGNEFVASFVGRSNLLRCEVLGHDGEWTTGRTEGGDVVTTSRVAAARGEPLLLMVRPELIELAAPGVTGVNSLRGRVSQVAFLGAAREYLVDVGGKLLIVQQPAGPADRPAALGDEVTVRWAPASAVHLAGATSGAEAGAA